MVPAAVVIAFLLLGVEEIGVQIEEPFGILPLGRLLWSAAVSLQLCAAVLWQQRDVALALNYECDPCHFL